PRAAAPSAIASAPPPDSAPPAPAPRPPPPAITAPMPGEPAAVALGEARLITSSCDTFQEVARQQAEARLKQMRAEVDASFRSWHDAQPGCWEEFRWKLEEERAPSMGWGAP